MGQDVDDWPKQFALRQRIAGGQSVDQGGLDEVAACWGRGAVPGDRCAALCRVAEGLVQAGRPPAAR